VLCTVDVSQDVLHAQRPWLRDVPARVLASVTTASLYTGYLPRQEAEIRGFRRENAVALADDIDFAKIGGLSTELREKLAQARPATVGAASRIQGMTPAALMAIASYARRERVQAAPAASDCFT
jgi:tRNA uridine 5-carboxymethylaminomethyl modification enzyme